MRFEFLPLYVTALRLPLPVLDVTQGGTYRLHIGNRKWMERNAVRLPQTDLTPLISQDEEEGRTVVYAAIDGHLVALVTIADPIKPEAALTVAALKVMGIHVGLLTGDNTRSATSIARKVGFLSSTIALRTIILSIFYLSGFPGRMLACCKGGVSDHFINSYPHPEMH